MFYEIHLGRMQMAIDHANSAMPEDVPVGACVYSRLGELLACAHNRRERDNDPTAHAEILALRMAGDTLKSWHLDDCVMYVTLEPCGMCAEAIIQSRLACVYYGTDDVQDGNARALKQANIQVYGGLMADQCRNLLSTFFKKLRTRTG